MENTTQTTVKVKAIKVGAVMSVYNGKVGGCCCGCSGKHAYASQYQAQASKDRGYAVTDDEVSDVSVKRTVNKLNKNMDKVKFEDGLAWYDDETRTHVVYFVK